MEELRRLYDVLKSKGLITKSFEEFAASYNDEAYRDRVFSAAVDNGLYTKSKDEFLTKYAAMPGVTQGIQADTVFEDEKKKEGTDSSSTSEGGDGTSEQSGVDPFTGTILAAQPVDQFEKASQGVTGSLIEREEEYTVPELQYNFGQYGFTFEETGATDGMNVTAANGKTLYVELDPWFGIGAEDEARKLREFLKENKNTANASVEQRAQAMARMDIKIQSESEINDAVKAMNAEAQAFEAKANQLALEYKAHQEARKQFDNLTSAQLVADPELKGKYDAWLQTNKEINANIQALTEAQKVLMGKGANLDRLAGEYYTMKGQQGTWAGGLWNAFLTGSAKSTAGLVASLSDLAVGALPLSATMGNIKDEVVETAKEKGFALPSGYENMTGEEIIAEMGEQGKVVEEQLRDYAMKTKYFDSFQQAKQGVYRNPFSNVAASTNLHPGWAEFIREGLPEVAGSESTTEQWAQMQKESFWGGAILGVTESIPAMAIGMGQGPAGWATRTALMYGQVSDNIRQEMEANPMFDDVSEKEKYAVIAPVGIAVAVLESIGFRNLTSKNPYVARLVTNALGKTGENATAKTFADVIRQDVESAMARGLLSITSAGMAEFETGFFQEIAESGIKDIYNVVKGKDYFDTPDTWQEYLANAVYAGAQEAVGGFIMGVPGALSDAVNGNKLPGLPNEVFEMFEEMTKDENYTSMFVTNLKQKVAAGEMTQEQADEQLNTFNQVRGVYEQIPTDFSVEQKKEALGLLYQKQRLERVMEGKDPILVKVQKRQLDAVNGALEQLLDEAYQEQVSSKTQEEQAQQEEAAAETGPIVLDIEGLGEVSAATETGTQTQPEVEAVVGLEEQVSPEERMDIESFFSDETTEDKNKLANNLSINTTNAELVETQNPIKETILKSARLGAKAISRVLPNTRIVLHENNEEYMKYVGREGNAEYVPSQDVIHVNLSKAGVTTVPHEIFHAVFINKVKTDEVAAKRAEEMMMSVRKSLSDASPLAKRIDTFAEQYQGEQAVFQNEERLAELTGILASEFKQLSKPSKNVIVKFLTGIAKRFGLQLDSDFTTNDEKVIDLLNTLSKKVAKGVEITEQDIETLDNGTNPIGSPTEIRVPESRQSKIDFKESYDNSLVTPDKQIDIYNLLEDIAAKKQKVWFWVADQLGISEDLDGGPSFSHQVEGDIWASSMAVSRMLKNIKNTDYLFIISGSPTNSKLFNKKVFDRMTANLGDYNTFKEQALATNPVKAVKEALEKFPSWEAMREAEGTSRKSFLIALNESKSKPNTAFHKYVQSLNGYEFDVDAMRDGFYRENDFNQNDIMLVLKPTDAREGSNHSTYTNTLMGEVVGVPNAKVNALEVMPKEMAEKYAGKPTQAAQAIAPYGSGTRQVTTAPSPKTETDTETEKQPAARQQRTIEQVAQQWNMNIQGFFPNNVDAYNLRKAVRALGYDIKQSRVDSYGRGGSYYLVNQNGRKVNPFDNRARQQRTMEQIIQEGRDANFRDAVIRDFLVRVKGFSARVVDKALEVNVDIFAIMPDSFKNVQGGVQKGAKLFEKVNNFRKKLTEKNSRNTRLTPRELEQKIKEYAAAQRETYDSVQEINDKVKAKRELLNDKNSRAANPKTRAEINAEVRAYREQLTEARDAKREKARNKVDEFRLKETKKNNRKAPLLTEQEIVDKTIEFLEAQPEYQAEADMYTAEGETRARKGLSTQQAKMLSDIQNFVGIRPTQEMAAKIRKARLMIQQRRKGARDLQAIKSELRNFIRKTLPPELYTKKEVVDMVRKIELANQDNIENLYNEVVDLATKKNAEALLRSVKTILEAKYTQDVSGRKKAKRIDLQTKERIDFINEKLLDPNATAEEIATANEALMKEWNELNASPEQNNETRSRMVDLEIAMGLNNVNLMDNTDIFKVAELDRINAALVEMIEFGSTALKQELEEAHNEYVRQFEYIYEDITGEPIDMNEEDADGNKVAKQKLADAQRKRANEAQNERLNSRIKGAFKKIGGAIELVFTSTEALDGLMDLISKLPGDMFGGRTQELVTERIDEASRKFKGRRMYVEGKIYTKLEEIYGKGWKAKVRENRKINATGIFLDPDAVREAESAYEADKTSANKKKMQEAYRQNELVLSQDQMYYLVNQYKDPANEKSFENKYGKDYKRIMEQMEAALTPEVKEFAEWQVNEFFPELYEHYNETYKKIYRTNLPWNKHYAGRIYREGVEPEPLDLLADNSTYNTSVGAASTKGRINNNHKIQDMNGTDALFTYLSDMEYFAAYAEPIRDINKLFTNEYIKGAIESMYGKKTMGLIKDAVQKIANKGTRGGLVDSLINNMNNVFILSRLALSPVIMLKQLTSLFTYANDIGIANWIKYGAKNTTEFRKIWKEISENSTYMQDRKYESIMKSIESYSDDGMRQFVPSPTKNFLIDAAMFFTKFGDRTAIFVGGMPNYSYYKAQAMKDGKTEDEAIQIAVRKFERDTKRTQQSGDLQDKDIFQTSNPIIRAANLFLTTPKQYLRKEIQAVRSLNRKLVAWDRNAGKGTIGQNVRTLAMYHVFMPVFFQWVAGGMPGLFRPWRDDDEEDMLRAAIMGNLNALFILGEVATTIGDVMTHKPWAGASGKQVGILNMSAALAQKFMRAEKTKDPEKKAEAMKDFYLELTTLTGIPAPTINKFIENYGQIGNGGNIETDILRLLNYSEYQISGPKEKGKKKDKTPSEKLEELNKEYEKSQRELEKEEKERMKQSSWGSKGWSSGKNEFGGEGFSAGGW